MCIQTQILITTAICCQLEMTPPGVVLFVSSMQLMLRMKAATHCTKPTAAAARMKLHKERRVSFILCCKAPPTPMVIAAPIIEATAGNSCNVLQQHSCETELNWRALKCCRGVLTQKKLQPSSR